MKFVIQSIRKKIELWDHQSIDSHEMSLEMEITPFGDCRLDIGDNLILCNDDYYTNNKESIGKRKQIESFLQIHNRDKVTEESKKEISDSIGLVFHHTEFVCYTVFLKQKLFDDLMNQINLTKNLTLSIVIDDRDREGNKVITSESWIGDSHDHWKVLEESNNQQPIKFFTLNFLLT